MAGSNYVYTITLNAGQVSSTLAGMESRVQSATDRVGGLQSAFERIGRTAFAFVNISDSIGRMMSGLEALSGPGMALNAQMQELSAITGVAGKGLKQIEGYAREAAQTFGGSAADSVEAYKLVLSQLGPEIAQVPEALASMGDHIKTASKLMGGDTAAAAEVLATAMNQYQVALDDPIAASAEMARMMNAMAAAGQAGSAELPAIKEALSQAGMVAKTAGVSFEEANAAIQMLDKAGKKGSEGGVALRNVMTTLMQGRFLPKDVQDELAAAGVSVGRLTDRSLSLTDRLRGLTPVMSDQSLISKMFGRENTAAALAMLSALDPIDELTAAISGNNSAYEQAGVIMESDIERMSRFQARVDDLKIGLYNLYGGMLPYIKGFASAMQMAANTAMGVNAIHALSETALGAAIRRRMAAQWQAARATVAASGSLGAFSAVATPAIAVCYGLAAGFRAIGKAIYSIPVIGWIAAGIGLAIKGIQLLWDKCEGFRQVLFGVWEWLKAMSYNAGVFFRAVWDEGIKPVVDSIGNAFRTVADGIVNVFNRVKDGIANAFNWVWEKVSGVFDRIRHLATSVTEWVSEKFAWLIGPVKRVFTKIADFVSGTFEKVKNGILGTVEGIKSWFSGKGFQSGRDAYLSGVQKGSESFAKDHPEERKPGTAAMPAGSPGLAQPSTMQQATTGGNTTASSGTLDLDNVKGSTDYAAIAAKLQPKTFTGLGGGKAAGVQPAVPAMENAAMPGTAAPIPELPSFLEAPADKTPGLLQQIAADVSKMAAGIAIVAMPAMPLAAAPVLPPMPPSEVMVNAPAMPLPAPTGGHKGTAITVQQVQPAGIVPVAQPDDAGHRSIRFGKFCEKVEITVPQGTTEGQVGYIINELMRRINDAVE